MKFFLLCKRYYTNKDLIEDRFGRLFYLPAQLKNNGAQGVVVAADYRHKTPTTQQLAGVDFHSVPFSLMWPVSFLLHTYRRFTAYKPDIIIASGDIHFGVLGLIFAKLAKIPFVFDVYDQYAAFGSGSLPGMKSLYYLTLRKADLVLCASLPMVDFAKKFNRSVAFIPNGVDRSLFKPMNRKRVRNELALSEDAVIAGYFGSSEKNRGVEILIEACKMLRRRYPGLMLLMAGKLSVPLTDAWINHRGMVSQQEVARLINTCDIVVIPYIPDTLIDMGNSCKIAEYLACGVPIVTTRVGNFMENYAEAPAILSHGICEPMNPKDMARAISAQIEAPRMIEFNEELTWERLGKKLFRILNELVHEG